jgi:hypothetical protein
MTGGVAPGSSMVVCRRKMSLVEKTFGVIGFGTEKLEMVVLRNAVQMEMSSDERISASSHVE